MGPTTKAGIWVRFAAFWIDGLLVFGCVYLAVVAAREIHVYMPLELSILLVAVVYWSVLTKWRGQTAGKFLCGLQVHSAKDPSSRPSLASTLVRESIGKILSAIFLLIGFIWIAWSKNRRAWHDYLAGTQVTRTETSGRRTKIAIVLGIAAGLSVTGGIFYQGLAVYISTRQVAADDQVRVVDNARAAINLVSFSTLMQDDTSPYVEWLNQHGQEPATYAVEVAGQHQVTIFGEGRHGDTDYLAFFNRIIPDLYQHAQVTCIALESIPSSNNERLSRLLTAPTFDVDLALQILRTELWQRGVSMHHLQFLETVWEVNQAIPTGQKKLRVIGMDIDADLPSWAMLGLGDDGLETVPPWEKLRVLRLLDDIPRLLFRDELMAHAVIQEAIEKEDRIVILVGSAHSFLNYAEPRFVRDGKVVTRWRRMGYLLHDLYGERIFQIRLHYVVANYSPPILGWLEQVMAGRQNIPVGFTVAGSPFAKLQAGYPLQPSVSLADIASGYIFLKPTRDYVRSEGVPEYISEEMFWRNKPFYETLAGRSLRDAQQANEVSATIQRR